MSNIRTLKALYQPISTAATKSVLSSVAQDEKDLAKEQAELSSIMKSAASLGSRFAKDKKAFDIAKKGGFGFNLKEASVNINSRKATQLLLQKYPETFSKMSDPFRVGNKDKSLLKGLELKGRILSAAILK